VEDEDSVNIVLFLPLITSSYLQALTDILPGDIIEMCSEYLLARDVWKEMFSSCVLEMNFLSEGTHTSDYSVSISKVIFFNLRLCKGLGLDYSMFCPDSLFDSPMKYVNKYI